jgi:hypothetical protein
VNLIANPDRSLQHRVDAVHQLGANLGTKEIADLSAFLEARPEREKNMAGLRYLKNEILTALRSQSTAPAGLTEVMVRISRDTSQDLVTRDYALQHMALWGEERARDGVGSGDRIRMTLKETAQRPSSLAGTALLGLHRLTDKTQGMDGEEVNSLALEMANSRVMPTAARSTAIAICGERGIVEVLPTLEAEAQGSGPVGLRISAIGALGRLGGPKQVMLLQRLESLGQEPTIQCAVAAALRRLEPALASRGPF